MKKTLGSDKPIFLQIKENIEEDILKGALNPDDQIPSTNQIVAFYNVNPVTVLKGVNLLAEEGIVYKKRGIGMFVSQDAPKILRARDKGAFKKEYIEPLVRKARQLGFDEKALAEIINQTWRGEQSNDND